MNSQGVEKILPLSGADLQRLIVSFPRSLSLSSEVCSVSYHYVYLGGLITVSHGGETDVTPEPLTDCNFCLQTKTQEIFCSRLSQTARRSPERRRLPGL